uniref:Uncharacterized protein n=1 Tax=Taeniopygia guttata TaxID=59729 RepID=A0A674G910_TAEGU
HPPHRTSSPSAKHTHKFKHVPVKDVVIGEALAVEEVAEELPQVRVVRLIIKPQEQRTADGCGLPSNLPFNSEKMLSTPFCRLLQARPNKSQCLLKDSRNAGLKKS